MAPLASELAEWIVGVQVDDIPPQVQHTAVRAFIDTIGVILAGAGDEIASRVHRWVEDRPRTGGVVVPPFGLTTDPETAALALGVLAHALDLDDIHPSTLGHPSAVLVPIILTLAPVVEATGEEAIAAYVIGAEIMAHLGSAMAPQQYRRGWHTTSTMGVLSAASTAARLLRLDAASTGHALGLAASSACGLRANFGSNAKPLHAGLAASHGVMAALLARDGMTATSVALDGPLGYVENFAGDRDLCAAVPAVLGESWQLSDPGLQVKLYPCCGGGHRAIDAFLDLVREESLSAEDVETVTALVDPIVPTLLVYPRPKSVGEARFSLHHPLAAVLADGQLSVRHFTPEALKRDDLRGLGARIHMVVNPELASHQGGLTFAVVDVLTRDGDKLSRRADEPRGSGARPLSQGELEKKFFDCAGMYDAERDWTPALQAIRTLNSGGSIGEVLKALMPTD